MRNAHCAILVYDIREKSTAAKFPLWRNTLTHRGNKNIPILVAANKVDLLPKDKPAPDEVFSRCKQMETSAKKKINNSEALRWIAHELTMQVQRPGATCRGGAENVQMQRCRGAEVVQRSRCRAGVQSMCRGSEYLQGFRRGDCAGNCAEEVQIWRCSNRHAEVQVIVQAQWWFSRGAEVTRGGAKQVQR